MHLADIITLRPQPGGAIFFGLTRRCPLLCRHCSTASLMSSEQHEAGLFTRFADTFTPEDHPELVLMTGGEPLLRPQLVTAIARRARRAGARSALISGMFFAREERVPDRIAEAIASVDHFVASIDIFHEEQVSRAAVFAVLGRLLESGKDVSVQAVGLDDADPYLEDITRDVRETFDGRVPMLVAQVGAAGRAADWLSAPGGGVHTLNLPAALPCDMAAWPTIAYDGTVLACCNQDVIDRRGPEHLRLGHIGEDGWPEIRRRLTRSPLLRAVRTLGPQPLARRAGAPTDAGFCGTCMGFSERPEVARQASDLVAGEAFEVMEQTVERLQVEAGPTVFALRHGSPRYAGLVTLGHREEARS
ncbi:Radical SAM superfamily enzyme, MoaA/NifB/PqqE/SkfB family [Nonomuraea solani]|uniref:Radical SAM superfamily enzyme, MoaA/NifB/PqqE/SkfB family n=1 Tax=Nonomuraea solani TaxID=1144553 RepID=A0A1H5W900_9ACTN|nr:radical SAM protein [Nonomuraea solani]SEF95736.1 Radical SAM superfamily enzyme, MoaA/NifB/PqqE/SkfB family [Nonomuraea solani]